MINIPEKNCINCASFAWWDGDYCCTRFMKILQESPDGKFNNDILMSLKLNKDCKQWNKNENSLYEESFNDFLKMVL